MTDASVSSWPRPRQSGALRFLLELVIVAGMVPGLLLAAAQPVAAQKSHNATTFSRDVAPIFYRHCVSCHREGAIGGFSLVGFREARPWARAVREQVVARRMPPWPPVAGYGSFQGERVLSDAEVDIIRRWVTEGAQEGDPAHLPPPPVFPDGWRLGQPDLVVTLDEPYVLPPGGEDMFRNFVIPIPVEGTRYVRTLELHPGSLTTVHHAIMAVDETRSSRRRDAADAAPGFEGMDMGQAFMPDGHLVGWTPGMTPFPGIEGLPWRLDPGTDLVLQLHLLPADRPVPLKPEVGVYFADAPPTRPPMRLIRLDADDQLDIPPGEREFVVTDALKLPVSVTVHSVYPHAHLIGKTVEGWATLPDGTRRWLIKIDDWDFGWQDIYRLAEPIGLPAGTTLHMRFAYDNSAANPRNPTSPPRRVTAGNRSSDEMAHLQLQVQLETADDVPRLEAAMYRRAIERNAANPWSYRGLGNALRDLGEAEEAITAYRGGLAVDPQHVPTHVDLGAVLAGQGRLEEALGHFQQAVRLDPGSADALYNLGTTLTLLGRSSEAVASLQEAVRLEPTFAQAQTNLGQALLASGRPDDAVAYLERAIALDPASAEAHNNLGAALGMLGRFAAARTHFQQALAIEPGHVRARENLELVTDILASSPE